MHGTDTDLLFPHQAITSLRDLRGQEWQALVDKILDQEITSLDNLAFVLMMVRMGGCTSCQSDSYRAMRGCVQCAMQTIRRFRGDDQELEESFYQARQDVMHYMEKV